MTIVYYIATVGLFSANQFYGLEIIIIKMIELLILYCYKNICKNILTSMHGTFILTKQSFELIDYNIADMKIRLQHTTTTISYKLHL